MPGEQLTKVSIQLEEPGYDVEALWAEPVAGGLYRLRNVPFLAYGYSEQDVVSAAELHGRLMVIASFSRSRQMRKSFARCGRRSQLSGVLTSGQLAV